MLLLLPIALAGVLGVSTSSPAMIRVDGESLPMLDGNPAWMELAPDRLHVIEARTTSDRPIANLELMTPDGIEVLVEWRGRNFAITEIRAVAPVAGGTGTRMQSGGVTVQIGGMPGLSVSVSDTGSSPAPALPPVSTAPVVVELIPRNTEWSNVWIDGEKVAEFRVGDAKKNVVLTPGPHRVEVRDFMEDETWVIGTIYVTAPGPMKLSFSEEGAEVLNRPEAWALR